MSSETYTPRQGSVVSKVIEFLTANPDEQLDADLISAKCDCDRRNVHTLLGPAVQAGLLHRAEDIPSAELVYTLGAGTQAKRKPSGQPMQVSAPPPARSKKHVAAFRIDVGNVQIDKDVPLPSRSGVAIDWASLFDRLEVGHSFPLPIEGRSAVTTAMKAYKDATGKTMACRTVDGGIRVWRTK